MLARTSFTALSLALLAGGALAGRDTIVQAPVFVPSYGPVFVPPAAPSGPLPAAGNDAPDLGEDIGQWAGTWMANASAFCASLEDSAYQIDCLAERIEYIAWQMQGSPAYEAVRAELLKAADDLEAVARKYRDGDKPGRVYATPASGRVGPQRSTRPIGAVRKAQQEAAVAEARAIVARTETVLLRSSGGTPSASPQITRIAAAVGSNKVLLRST